MGAPTSEGGYTSATTRRGDHEVCMDMWWHWEEKKFSFDMATCYVTTRFDIDFVLLDKCTNRVGVIYQLT
jgi:hypothetical protein